MKVPRRKTHSPVTAENKHACINNHLVQPCLGLDIFNESFTERPTKTISHLNDFIVIADMNVGRKKRGKPS